MAVCKSCGAAITWVILQGRNGAKAHPVNEATERRLVQVGMSENGTAMVLEQQPTWVSHFATCPNAAQHRGGSRGGAG